MNIEYAEIIKEIRKNHANDTEFLVSIVDDCTTDWELMRDVVKKLINILQIQDELQDILEITLGDDLLD